MRVNLIFSFRLCVNSPRGCCELLSFQSVNRSIHVTPVNNVVPLVDRIRFAPHDCHSNLLRDASRVQITTSEPAQVVKEKIRASGFLGHFAPSTAEVPNGSVSLFVPTEHEGSGPKEGLSCRQLVFGSTSGIYKAHRSRWCDICKGVSQHL